ncbi:aminoglycoside phosphotransferase family protein [Tissierella carlieri]|nr:aminoglycoside phosphotransferase family protein [Tissierella carlieri]
MADKVLRYEGRTMDKERLSENVKKLIEKKTKKQVDIEMTNLQFVNEGFSNDIAMFNLKYYINQLEFSKDVVFKDYSKVYKGNNGVSKYKKELAIFKSYLNSDYINIPEIYFEDEEKTLIIIEKIKGKTLDKIYINDREQFGCLMKRFGETLGYIHFLDINSIKEVIPGYYTSQKKYFSDYIESLKYRIINLGEMEYLEILDSLCRRFKEVNFNNICLNHGDYHFWNVIFTDKKQLYILDWEKSKIADCRYDIANTLIFCYSWFGIDLKEYMLEGYVNVTRKDIQQLECFEALLSFDSFTACVPFIQGADDSYVRDKTYMWIKRPYDLFVKNNGRRMEKAEEYLKTL